MNRYQLDVTQMDRRHQLVVRTLSFVGAAVLIVAALWGAGFPPSEWPARMYGWIDEPNSAPLPAQTAGATPAAAAPSTPANVPAVGQEGLAGTDSSISATPQPLYLIATAPGRNKNEGTAQIGTTLENPQTYMGGAMLANGARLAEIHRDHVLLVRGDRSATLQLYRRDHVQRPASDELLQVGGAPPTQPTAALVQVEITSYLRPNPVFDGELLRGYEVYPGPRAAVFSQLGLQSGDLITALDDLPLNDTQQAMALFEQLVQGHAMVATIKRKNNAERITLDGSLISADQQSAQSAGALAASPPVMPPG